MIARRLRPLGGFEKLILKTELIKRYTVFTMTIIFEHPPRTPADRTEFYMARLRDPLKELIQKHPMLSVTVVDPETDPWFVAIPEIDLNTIVRFSDESLSLEDEIAKEANECPSIRLGEAMPLWSVLVKPLSDTRVAIIIAMSHIIGDGVSIKTLSKELIEAIITGEQVPQRTTGDIIAWPGKSVLPAYSDRPTSLYYTKEDSPPKAPVPPPSEAPEIWRGESILSVERVDTVQSFVALEDWQNIVEASKRNGVTPHAATQAAFLLTIKDLWDMSDRTIATRTPVNLREICKMDTAEIGNVVGSIDYYWTPSDLEVDLWSLARIYHSKLHHAIDHTPTVIYKYPQGLDKYPEDFDKMINELDAAALEDKNTPNSCISDLGLFLTAEPNQTTGWKFADIWFAQSSVLNAKVVCLSLISLPGKMRAAFAWQRGLLDNDKMHRFGKLMTGKLRDAVRV